VAASGQTEGMRPVLAVTLLLVSVVGLIALLFVSDRFKLHNIAPLDNSPDVLATRAREVVRQLGYTEPYADEAFSFSLQGDYLNYVEEHDKSPDRWNALASGRPASIVFWYRQSPRQMRAQRFFSSIGGGEVTTFDPPMYLSGMVLVILDMQGRLLHLEAVPPQKDTPTDKAVGPDWLSLLAAAGLDPSAFHSVAPEWTPLAWGDARAAWLGTLRGKMEIPERIEAADYRGRPVYFDVIYPWIVPDRAATPIADKPRDRISTIILLVLFLAVTISGVCVARRNVQLKRSDSRGAARLGVAVFLIFAAMWTLSAHHVGSIDEFDTILIALGWALLITTLATILYLALEPYVRRRDPHTLISWTRLLAGQWRDPLVGRDILVGTCYGVLLTLFEMSDNLLLPLFGKLPPMPNGIDPHTFLGVRLALGGLLFYILAFLLYSLLIFFFLFLLRLVFRHDGIAALILVLIATGTNSAGEYPVFTYLYFAVIWSSIVLVLKKAGLLAIVVGLVVQNVLVVFPMSSHLSRWYANSGLTGIIVISALLIFGFFTALAGRPLFTGAALDQ